MNDQVLRWLNAVDGSGREARERALDEMRTAGLEQIIRLLAAKLADPDTEVRGKAVTTLCLLDAERAVELVLPLLEDPAVEIRWHTSGCLHDFGDERAVEPLMAVLEKDPDPMVRNTAAYALGGIGSPAAIPALIKVMDNDHEVDELGYTPSSAAMTALDDILGTEETRLKHSESLRQMSPEPPDLDRLRYLATEVYERWLSGEG
jgi:HEAT repeat protein